MHLSHMQGFRQAPHTTSSVLHSAAWRRLLATLQYWACNATYPKPVCLAAAAGLWLMVCHTECVLRRYLMMHCMVYTHHHHHLPTHVSACAGGGPQGTAPGCAAGGGGGLQDALLWRGRAGGCLRAALLLLPRPQFPHRLHPGAAPACACAAAGASRLQGAAGPRREGHVRLSYAPVIQLLQLGCKCVKRVA